MTSTFITPARRTRRGQFAALQRRSRHRAVALAAAALFGPWAAAPAAALTCNWLPSGGNWGTAALWSCGAVPTGPNVDTANIGLGQQVNIDNLDGASNFRSDRKSVV